MTPKSLVHSELQVGPVVVFPQGVMTDTHRVGRPWGFVLGRFRRGPVERSLRDFSRVLVDHGG